MACRCYQCKEKLAKVNGRLRKLAHSRYRLSAQGERNYLESLLQSVENSVHSHFCGLPIELQTKIFQYATTDPQLRSSGRKGNRVLLLGAVCHGWRVIAWGNPLLWKTLRIYIYQRNPRLVAQLAQEWLERSEPLQELDIVLYSLRRSDEPRDYDKKVAELVTVINESSHRWGTLNLEIPLHYAEKVYAISSPRMLTGVRIFENDFERQTPVEEGPLLHRQSILMGHIIGYHVKGMPSVKSLDFSMRFSGAGYAQTIYYAFLAENLEILCISGIQLTQLLWGTTHILEVMSRPITRPCLRVLSLDMVPPDFVLRFMEWAKFPNLTKLTVTHADLTSSRTFHSFLSQCSKSLRTFNLGIGFDPVNLQRLHEDMLVNTLEATPCLQNLVLRLSYISLLPSHREPAVYSRLLSRLSREVDLTSGERPFLPQLEVLELGSLVTQKVKWSDIPMLFYPLQDTFNVSKAGNHKFLPCQRPLRLVSIYISHAAAYSPIDLETLKQLSTIAQNRRVQFRFMLHMGQPVKFCDILKASAAMYGLVWDRYLQGA
ncbi:hypothetical protein M413DRAFT_28099 [Hebeloma cylindrosporum]|uniref:Uncharacterized protein n=1 Tax=Hebeloma cylindrosporum TaxID=76867 RepID=A0A0C2YIX0_HEBCY|nr:hypothetical protein M413DRAFT_28099 [Hebeloma cylindrosporum h7]